MNQESPEFSDSEFGRVSIIQTIEQAQATADAGNATVQEAKTDWNLL